MSRWMIFQGSCDVPLLQRLKAGIGCQEEEWLTGIKLPSIKNPHILVCCSNTHLPRPCLYSKSALVCLESNTIRLMPAQCRIALVAQDSTLDLREYPGRRQCCQPEHDLQRPVNTHWQCHYCMWSWILLYRPKWFLSPCRSRGLESEITLLILRDRTSKGCVCCRNCMSRLESEAHVCGGLHRQIAFRLLRLLETLIQWA